MHNTALTPDENAPSGGHDHFAALYSKIHLDLLRYVLTLVPERANAEDVVQDTARTLWQKFAQYDAMQPFLPWARKFAWFEVLKFRKRQVVRGKFFSDELVEQLAEERSAREDELAAQRSALAGCVEKLDESSRRLVQLRYAEKLALLDVAAREGKSANALYLTMHRIRQRLLECVNRALRMEGWA